MKPNIILMNFTHVYEQERFINDIHFQWIDCTDLNGTNCYCDAEAAKVIRQRMAPYLPQPNVNDGMNALYTDPIPPNVDGAFSMIRIALHA